MHTLSEEAWLYVRLVAALGILITEFVARRTVLVLFRFPPLQWIATMASGRVSGIFGRTAVKHQDHKAIEADTPELIASRGYPSEEHIVKTEDGYVLALHRIPYSGSSHPQGCRPVVLLQHGFMMCSEVWVCGRTKNHSLAFVLADAGYDVWMGNMRGNKYSQKHVTMKPSEERFWDFCLDDHARDDIPSMINYILKVTERRSLSYIAFSNGTACGFAAFSRDPLVASKVDLFVALAATHIIKGLYNPIADAVARTRPGLTWFMFGRKTVLPYTLFWRRMLGPTLFAKVIDASLLFLFNWKSRNMKDEDKPLLYAHLFSFSPVKGMAHWFQITASGRFQMYDDSFVLANKETYSGVVPPRYDVASIRCPIAVFYGGCDTVPDSEALLADLPSSTYKHFEEEYEHLDFLWADNAKEHVWPRILSLLQRHAKGNDGDSKRGCD